MKRKTASRQVRFEEKQSRLAMQILFLYLKDKELLWPGETIVECVVRLLSEKTDEPSRLTKQTSATISEGHIVLEPLPPMDFVPLVLEDNKKEG